MMRYTKHSHASGPNILNCIHMKSNIFNQNIYSLLFYCFGFALLSCSAKREETVRGSIAETNTVVLNEAQLNTANIQLGVVEQKNISNTLRANGKLDVPPQNLVSISAPFGGFLKNTELLQGKFVEK